MKGNPENKSGFFDNLKENLSNYYSFFEDWMRPNPSHSKTKQILLFALKLPVLIIGLILSPILFVVMMIVLLIAV